MEIRCNNCFNLFDSDYEMCPYCGYSKGDPAQEPYFLVPGTVLSGRYTVGKAIGFGGFGITYKAWDNQLESVVAIKEYYPSGIVNRPPNTSELILFSGEKRKEFEFGLSRFIDEARNTTKFNDCENIVSVFEYFEENNTAYFVMEFLDGMNLSEYLTKCGGKIPLEQGLDITFKICNALKSVHEAGFIHRDISPDNIFMCNSGLIKLIDFGAARFSAEEKNYTIILKPGFAPPEQYEQVSEQGPKTDVYALGATLYYIITGEKPDESSNRKIQDIIKEPIELDDSIPQYINDSILKAMAMEPSLRFESVDLFEKSLKKEIEVTSLKKEKRTRKRKRFIGISALASVLLAIAVIFALNLKEAELKDATIEVWYVAEPDSELDAAYQDVFGQFSAEYKNVKVKVKGFSAEEYDYQLYLAARDEKLPSLFVSTNQDDTVLEKASDVREVLFPEKQSKVFFLIKPFMASATKSCYFLSDYDELFPDSKQIPISFNVPVLYANKSIIKGKDAKSIQSYEDLAGFIDSGETLVALSEQKKFLTKQMKNDESIVFSDDAATAFAQGKYSMYFGDTSSFLDLRKMSSMDTGISEMVVIRANDAPAVLSSLWSIGAKKENEYAAASRLLSFLLSANAQRIIFGRSGTERALPINKEAVEALEAVYEDFKPLDGYIKKCVPVVNK